MGRPLVFPPCNNFASRKFTAAKPMSHTSNVPCWDTPTTGWIGGEQADLDLPRYAVTANPFLQQQPNHPGMGTMDSLSHNPLTG
eukprot:3876933-Amphidinium_carterae.1